MKRLLLGLGAVIVLVLVVALVRTLTVKPEPSFRDAEVTPVPEIPSADVAQHLAALVRFKTISFRWQLSERRDLAPAYCAASAGAAVSTSAGTRRAKIPRPWNIDIRPT